MGKKLDALLGRSFKTTKFKASVNLAISRLSVLKNQHHARFSVARSDVIQILNLGHHERALLRVEQVIKEQNMLDVFVMLENYCYLLIERVNLLEHAKECPEELKEAVASMIYAATRCGEFPELQELRAIFTSRFGKEFVARAVELRNNCGVNPKMIQKLSTRMPSMENRVKVLKEIALENDISLQIDEIDSVDTEMKMEAEKKESKTNPSNDSKPTAPEEFTNSTKMRRKYKDVADAAQAAFVSAAYAAEAARVAVELSQSDSHGPSDPRNPAILESGKVADSHKHIESKLHSSEMKDSRGIETGVGLEKSHLVQNYYSGTESEDDEMHTEIKDTKNKLMEESEQSEKEAEYNRSLSTSSLDSEDNTLNQAKEAAQTRPERTEIAFDESDDERVNARNTTSLSGSSVVDSTKKYAVYTNEVLGSGKARKLKDYVAEESEMEAYEASGKQFRLKSQAGSSTGQNEGQLRINRTPMSVRTRRTYRR